MAKYGSKYDPKDDEPLSLSERDFMEFYFRNGRKVKEAYLALGKHVTEKSAKDLGAKLLKKIEKHPEFVEKNRQIIENYGWPIERVISELQEIIAETRAKKKITKSYKEGDKEVFVYQPDTAVKAIERLCKVLGHDKETALRAAMQSEGDNAIRIIRVSQKDVENEATDD